MLVTKIRAKEIRTMTHDLTTGKPLRDIWQFAVPVLFGLLLQQVYSLVDTAIVGHALGGCILILVACHHILAKPLACDDKLLT